MTNLKKQMMTTEFNESVVQGRFLTENSSISTNSNTTAMQNSDLRALKLTFYAIIFFASAVGNSLVCTVILRRKKMKTVTNYFILNLAIADLTLNFICIPFDIPVQEMNNKWPYGALLCKIIYPLQTLALFASVYTLTAVSLSRYWAINHPLRQQLTIKIAKRIIFGIWIASLISVTPYMSVLKEDSETDQCVEDWSNKSARKTYTAFLFMFQYLLPLTIIAAAYVSISWELARRTRNGNGYLQDRQEDEEKKVVRMLKVVTLVFAVCVLPTNVMWLWLDFGNAAQYDKFWDLVAFCNIITFANSAANPICYTILNESYRKAFKDHLTKIFYKISKSSTGGQLELVDNARGQKKSRRERVNSTVL